jgi:hypothetical protein
VPVDQGRFTITSKVERCLTEFKYNKVLLVFIVIGLIASLVIGWQRNVVEKNNSRVEMVIDYEDIVELAQVEGVPIPELMKQFKEAGITSLAVYETTLEKLQKNGKLAVLSGGDLLARYRTGEIDKFPFSDKDGKINPSSIYIFASRSEQVGHTLFAEVQEDLSRRLGAERVHVLNTVDDRVGLAVDANYEKVLKWNLGLSRDEMRDVSAYGFNIVVRPTNYTKVKADDVNAVFNRINGFNNITGMMFVGDEVLGYPDLLPLTAQQLRERGTKLYMIEHPLQLQFLRQDGLLPLATATGYQVARTYVIPKEEQPKLKLDEAIHRWAITDEERNIRVNLLRKYDKPESGLSLIETNLNYVSGVRDELIEKGFTVGPAGIYQAYFANPWLLVLVTIGATAAGVLFLTLIRPFSTRDQYLLLLIISLLLSWPIAKGGGTLARQAVALASASIFPVLAMTWQLDRWVRKKPCRGSSLTRILADGLGGLTVTVLLSLVGGFYVGAILADVRFILEMEIFRGVKLTFVLPVLLIALTYLSRFDIFTDKDDHKGIIGQLAKILNYPIYVKTLVFVGLGAIAAWVFVGRSGHTAGVPVPAIELKLRTFLENTMYARPREKEFMIGHPAFLLAVMALYRYWPRIIHFMLVIVATIGQGSLVETFAHIRTPIFMSFVRGLDGLLVGAILGVIAVIGVQVLHYLSFLLGRRPAADE